MSADERRHIHRSRSPSSSPTDLHRVGPGSITKLRGPTKGVWFHLYVLIDIYSRYNPSWTVAAHESVELAAEFIAEAIGRNRLVPRTVHLVPHTVHTDRGTSITFGLVSELLTNLGIIRSHSRPRVSNDNPSSEAQFKTLKYLHDFLTSFASLHDARESKSKCVACEDEHCVISSFKLSALLG